MMTYGDMRDCWWYDEPGQAIKDEKNKTIAAVEDTYWADLIVAAPQMLRALERIIRESKEDNIRAIARIGIESWMEE